MLYTNIHDFFESLEGLVVGNCDSNGNWCLKKNIIDYTDYYKLCCDNIVYDSNFIYML